MSKNTDKLIELHIAVTQNNKTAVTALLKADPELNINGLYRGNSVLHKATTNNNTKMIHELLAGGVDVNIQDEQGDIPLRIAKSPAAFKILLDSNADPNIKNNEGRSVMDIIENPQHTIDHQVKSCWDQYRSDSIKNMKIPVDETNEVENLNNTNLFGDSSSDSGMEA